MTDTLVPAGLAGTTDHVDAGDGWLLVRLLTRQALVREGRHMDHCLADGGYALMAGEEDLAGDSIWSLRDPDGMSVVTLDVRRATVGRAQVVEARGPSNRPVRRSAARRLGPLVTAFRGAGVALDFAGETGLAMADDGRVMRKDRAPPEVLAQVRARHAAVVAEAIRVTPAPGVLPSGVRMLPAVIGAAVQDVREAEMPLDVRVQAAKALREAARLARDVRISCAEAEAHAAFREHVEEAGSAAA
jgi:hypothetical protein